MAKSSSSMQYSFHHLASSVMFLLVLLPCSHSSRNFNIEDERTIEQTCIYIGGKYPEVNTNLCIDVLKSVPSSLKADPPTLVRIFLDWTLHEGRVTHEYFIDLYLRTTDPSVKKLVTQCYVSYSEELIDDIQIARREIGDKGPVDAIRKLLVLTKIQQAKKVPADCEKLLEGSGRQPEPETKKKNGEMIQLCSIAYALTKTFA